MAIDHRALALTEGQTRYLHAQTDCWEASNKIHIKIKEAVASASQPQTADGNAGG